MTRPTSRGALAALLCCTIFTVSLPASSRADDDRTAELERKVDLLSRQVEALQLGGSPAPPENVPRLGLAPAAGKVYGARDGTSIGGYGEMLFEKPDRTRQDETLSGGVDRLDFLRAVFYVGHHFTEDLLFNSEIEWEHAGVVDEAAVEVDPASGEGEAELSGEVVLEFAYLDWRLRPWLGLRGGKLLVPVGFLNEMHEPPVFFGARRPEVERSIIPATWAANGAGLYGETASGWSWRAYVVEGLDAGGFRAASPIRGGRQDGSQSLATHPALTARGDFAGIPGLTFGGSLFTGDAVQGPQPAGERLRARTTLAEGHARWKRGGLEARALYARGRIENADAISDANGLSGIGRLGDAFRGGYLEVAYDVLPLIHAGARGAIAPYLRIEELDPQDGGLAPGEEDPALRQRILTAGLSLQPHPDVVLKIDRQQRRNDARTATSSWNAALGYLF